MGVKENVMIAGGVAAVIGIGKAMSRDVDIPGWLTIAVWVPIIAVLGIAGYAMYEFSQPKDKRRRKKNKPDIG